MSTFDSASGASKTNPDSPASAKIKAAIESQYENVKRFARARRRAERANHTLKTTELANLAFLKLLSERNPSADVPFDAHMARAVKQVLLDHDRSRKAQKRGGGKRPVGLDVERDAVATSSDEAALAGLHEGLLCMAKEEPALFQILHLRFQQGMTWERISAALAVPPSTLKRQAEEGLEWLRRKVEGTATPEEPD